MTLRAETLEKLAKDKLLHEGNVMNLWESYGFVLLLICACPSWWRKVMHWTLLHPLRKLSVFSWRFGHWCWMMQEASCWSLASHLCDKWRDLLILLLINFPSLDLVSISVMFGFMRFPLYFLDCVVDSISS